MSAIQQFHLAIDIATISALGAAVVQWRYWRRHAKTWEGRAQEAETARACALIFARHCHDRFVKLVKDTCTEAGPSPVAGEEHAQ